MPGKNAAWSGNIFFRFCWSVAQQTMAHEPDRSCCLSMQIKFYWNPAMSIMYLLWMDVFAPWGKVGQL